MPETFATVVHVEASSYIAYPALMEVKSNSLYILQTFCSHIRNVYVIQIISCFGSIFTLTSRRNIIPNDQQLVQLFLVIDIKETFI